MAYITIKELEDFAHKYPDEDEALEAYIGSAQEAIKAYLGYDPELAEYSSLIRGDEGNFLALKAKPITELKSIKIKNGAELDVSQFMVVDTTNYIQHEAFNTFDPMTFYEVNYKAGYVEVPYLIRMTALQIANLIWESSGGNLAVSSTSFADTGTRVFNNFTMDRFLKQIESYRIYNE